MKPFEPAADTVLGGSVRFKRVRIDRAVTVRVREDLELWSEETIVIEGSLIADVTPADRPREQRHGISLTLTADGDIDVAGTIAAGHGDPGDAAGVDGGEEISVGVGGHRGGDVILVSRAGRVRLRRAASLLAGNGGAGGRARGAGRDAVVAGQPGGNAVAVGGRGGDGGGVRLFGPAGVLIEQKRGLFMLGNGGDGGDASALGGTGGPEAEKSAAGNGGGVYASGGNGGNAGTIPQATLSSVSILDARGQAVPLDLKLLRQLTAGGNGGSGGRTEGRGGERGRATAQRKPKPPTEKRKKTRRR